MSDRARDAAREAALAALVALVTAWGVGALRADPGRASALIHLPVVDGVPLVDPERVLTWTRSAAGEESGVTVTARPGVRWNSILIEGRADRAGDAHAAVERVRDRVTDRQALILSEIRRTTSATERRLEARLDEARARGDEAGVREGELTLVAFRGKRDALLVWTDRLAGPVETGGGDAGPVGAAAVAFLVVGGLALVREPPRVTGARA